VTGVNTLVQRGKSKRMGRALAKRPNWKKAIVTLREGDDIQFFDETTDSKEQE
jgi:large subunit ribosomal protein L23